jgi:Zn-finger nucleic acid-binding protein
MKLTEQIKILVEKTRHPDTYHFEQLLHHQTRRDYYAQQGNQKKAMEHQKKADIHAAVLNRRH